MSLSNESNFFNGKKDILLKYYAILDKQFNKAAKTNSVVTKYLDLGVRKIKLEIANEEIIPRIEQNFNFTIKDNLDHYDSVLHIWKDDVRSFLSSSYQNKKYLAVVYNKQTIMRFFLEYNMLNAQNIFSKSFYFSASDFSDKILPKFGHLFVNAIFPATLTSHSSLAHAASVGIDNKGVLICASSGGGKTTLAITCLMDNFQYVSDDYLIINKENNILYSHPIYSMVTLTPQIYNNLTNLKSKFMYDNYNNTKYTLDISAYNNNFVKSLPIKAMIFPSISDISEPTIEKSNNTKAITQFVYSTAKQMDQHLNKEYVKLLLSLVKDLDCYQINLSRNLDKNVKILRQFIKEL